jgi:hypothetical protein
MPVPGRSFEKRGFFSPREASRAHAPQCQAATSEKSCGAGRMPVLRVWRSGPWAFRVNGPCQWRAPQWAIELSQARSGSWQLAACSLKATVGACPAGACVATATGRLRLGTAVACAPLTGRLIRSVPCQRTLIGSSNYKVQ